MCGEPVPGQDRIEYSSVRLSLEKIRSYSVLWGLAKVNRNQPELFKDGFEVVDDFLGDDFGDDL